MTRHAPTPESNDGAALDPAALDKIRALSPDGADVLVGQVLAAYLKAAEREWGRFDQGLADGDARRCWRALPMPSSRAVSTSAPTDWPRRCSEIEQLGREGNMRQLLTRVDGVRGEWQRVDVALKALLAGTEA